MSFFNTIVVATDFSETAEEALSAALEIGRETRGRLELVNVVPDPLQQPWMVEAAGVDLGALQHAWLHAAAKELQAPAEASATGSANGRHARRDRAA